MKPLNRKLHSARGAAILWALVMTAVLAVLGGAILSFAAANVSAAGTQVQAEQDRSTLQSAAGLVADGLRDASTVVNETEFNTAAGYGDDLLKNILLMAYRGENAAVEAPGFENVKISAERVQYFTDEDSGAEIPMAFAALRLRFALENNSSVALDMSFSTVENSGSFEYTVVQTIMNSGSADGFGIAGGG